MKEYKYKINGNEYSVAIIDLEGDKAAVEVNGVSYQVDILTEGYTAPAPRPAAKPAAAPAPAPAAAPAAPAPAPQPIAPAAPAAEPAAPAGKGTAVQCHPRHQGRCRRSGKGWSDGGYPRGYEDGEQHQR